MVIDAAVAEHDTPYGLSRIAFAGGQLWVGAAPHAVGAPVRARVLARDVSVTRHAPTETSVLNVLPVRLHSLHAERSTVLLQLHALSPWR